MKVLLFISISLVILSGCQDTKIIHETTNIKADYIPIPIMYLLLKRVAIVKGNRCFVSDDRESKKKKV